MWWCLLASSGLLWGGTVGAVERYFAATGNDGNPCTEAQPCKTYLSFDHLTAPGDRFLFKRGDTFSGTALRLNLEFSGSGTASQPLYYGAYGSGARPIFDSGDPGMATGLDGLDMIQNQWMVVEDLEFRRWSAGLQIRGVKDVAVRRVLVSSAASMCVHTRSYSGVIAERVLYEDVEVANCGFLSEGEGFYLGVNPGHSGAGDLSADITLRRVYVHDLPQEGVDVKNCARRVVIEHSRFENIATSGAQGHGIAMAPSSADCPGNNGDHTVRWNVITNTHDRGIHLGTGGVVAWNVIRDSGTGTADYGLIVEDLPNNNHAVLVEGNTLVGNFTTGLLIASSAAGTTTSRDNIQWANGAGNDATDPLFVNAASGDFNLQAGSDRLNAGTTCPHAGAVQTFSVTGATIAASGVQATLTTSACALTGFAPLATCTAASVVLTCATAGTVPATVCTANGPTTLAAGFATTIPQGDTCTLAVAAAALRDSAVPSLGGATNFAVSGLAVTNNSTTGTGGETAENLLTIANAVPGTCAACAASRPWSGLLDGDLVTEASSAGNGGITSFTGEHDLGASTPLDTFRAACDTVGNWRTQHVTFEYKVAVEDPYTVGVNHQPCNTDSWHDFVLGGVSGRYLRLTFFCETGCGGTQAREVFLSEAPQVLPAPGLRLISSRGLTQQKGVFR